MNRTGKRAIITIILINIALVAFAICGKLLSRFDYEDHLDEMVISIDDNAVTLREFGYYIYEIEAFVQNQALLYDPENPKHWWNTHFSAGVDSQFVCDYAKKVAINTCIMDEIYSQEAMAAGIVLSSEEEAKAESEAREMLSGMKKEQLEATGLSGELILKIKKKHTLASKYAQYLVENRDLTGYSSALQARQELVNWDGEYYQEEILPNHTVTMNDKVLNKITLGRITVNMQEEDD